MQNGNYRINKQIDNMVVQENINSELTELNNLTANQFFF